MLSIVGHQGKSSAASMRGNEQVIRTDHVVSVLNTPRICA